MGQIEELSEYDLTVDEVADLFGVNARTIRRWINDGKLPAHRLPGTRRFKLRRADLDKALGEQGGALPESGRDAMSSQDITSLLQAGAEES